MTGQPTFTVVVNPGEDTFVAYVNCCDVAANFSDVSIHFGRTPSKFTETDIAQLTAAKMLEVDATVQVTFSPVMLPQLIRALMTQREVYETRFGKILEIAP